MIHIMCTICIVHHTMAIAISATVGQTVSVERTVTFLFNKRKRLNFVVVHQLVVIFVIVISVICDTKGKRRIYIFYSFTKVGNIKKTALDFNICISIT